MRILLVSVDSVNCVNEIWVVVRTHESVLNYSDKTKELGTTNLPYNIPHPLYLTQ